MAKYCTKCGAKMQDDDLFCAECGAKSRSIEPSEPVIQTKDKLNEENRKKKNRKRTYILAGGAVCSGVILSAVFLIPQILEKTEPDQRMVLESTKTENTENFNNSLPKNDSIEKDTNSNDNHNSNIDNNSSANKNENDKDSTTNNIVHGNTDSSNSNRDSNNGNSDSNANNSKNEAKNSTANDPANTPSSENENITVNIVVFVKNNDLYLADYPSSGQLENPKLIAEDVFRVNQSSSQLSAEEQLNTKYELKKLISESFVTNKNRMFLCTRIETIQDELNYYYYTLLENGKPVELNGVMNEPLLKCLWDKEYTMLALTADYKLIKYDIRSGSQSILAKGVVDFTVDSNNLTDFHKILYLTDDKFCLLENGVETEYEKEKTSSIKHDFGDCTFLTDESGMLVYTDIKNDIHFNLKTSWHYKNNTVNDKTFFYISDFERPDAVKTIFYWNGKESVQITDMALICTQPSNAKTILTVIRDSSDISRKKPYIWKDGELRSVQHNGKDVDLSGKFFVGMTPDGKYGLVITNENILIIDGDSANTISALSLENAFGKPVSIEDINDGYIDDNQFILCTTNGMYKTKFDHKKVKLIGKSAYKAIYMDENLVLGILSKGNYICYKDGTATQMKGSISNFYDVSPDGSVLYMNKNSELIHLTNATENILEKDIDFAAVIRSDETEQTRSNFRTISVYDH